MLLACLLALAAGCGGSGAAGSRSTTRHRPGIPSAIAASLAGQADAVAAAAERGDGCGAVAAAQRLRDGVEAAVAAGRIPPRLAAPLQASATGLAAGLRCAPAPPRHHGPHPGHERPGHGKGKDKGEGD